MIELAILVFGCFIGFIVGARIGWNARERAAKKFVMNYLSQVNDEVQSNVVAIEVTKEGDTFLIHNKETGEFLAQGVNHEEISKILHQRFPTKTFVCTPDNLEKTGYMMSDV